MDSAGARADAPAMRWSLPGLPVLALLGLLAAGPALAQATPLYQARAIVTGTDLRARPEGFARCLVDVLVKVSGDPSLREDPAAAALAQRAALLIEDFDYQDRMGHLPLHDEQGSRDRPYTLSCRFAPRLVDQALRQLGRTPWTVRRPWLLAQVSLTDRAGDRFLLLADAPKGDGPRAALFTAAEGAGLRVSLPLENGTFPPGLLPLEGALRWSEADFGWVADWQLQWRRREYRWRVVGVSYDAAMRAGMRGAAAVLSGNAGKLGSVER